MSPTHQPGRLDTDAFSFGFFEHAVYNHWSPFTITFEDDRERLLEADLDDAVFEELRMALAQFGAGEEAVTEDLFPLAYVVDDVADELFLTSQIYEEAKHTVFFDRYWQSVVDPVAEECGYEVTSPRDARYFPDAYTELFERTHDAMHRLLDEDSTANQLRAITHYHLAVESVLAQSGYYGIERSLDDDTALPRLNGLGDGIGQVRADEGRHVGFGIRRLHELIHHEDGDIEVVETTLTDLLPLITGTLSAYSRVVDTTELVDFATERLGQRIETITNPHPEQLPASEDLR